MNVGRIIDRHLAKKGMSKLELHYAIADMYIDGEYCKYTNFSERLRKNRMTAEDLVYIALILDIDLNTLKAYLKRDIMLYNKANNVTLEVCNEKVDTDLEKALNLLNENSLYLGKNADGVYVDNIAGTHFKVEDYANLQYSINDIEKIDDNTYRAVYVSNEGEPFIVCCEDIILKEDKVEIIGNGVQHHKWYMDILLQDGNDTNLEDFRHLRLQKKYEILKEDFDYIMSKMGAIFEQEGATHKREFAL